MNTAVIKVGGSLALHPEKLRSLCLKLSELSHKHKLVVIPGGGEFADVARRLDERFSLSCAVSHRMAILGMDQYGFLLSDLTPNSSLTDSLEEVPDLFSAGKLPVFLPSKLLFSKDPLENSWDITSDSIAVYLAGQLHVSNILLVTDVDGIYPKDPKKHSEFKLIKKMLATELLLMQSRTSVDVFLHKLLQKSPVNCFVVNGQYPERVEAILNEQDTICTFIEGSISNKP